MSKQQNPQEEPQWNLLLGNGFSIWYSKLFHKAEELMWSRDSIISVMVDYMEKSHDQIVQYFTKQLNKAQESEDRQLIEDYTMIKKRLDHLQDRYGSDEEPKEKKVIIDWLKKATKF